MEIPCMSVTGKRTCLIYLPGFADFRFNLSRLVRPARFPEKCRKLRLAPSLIHLVFYQTSVQPSV